MAALLVATGYPGLAEMDALAAGAGMIVRYFDEEVGSKGEGAALYACCKLETIRKTFHR